MAPEDDVVLLRGDAGPSGPRLLDPGLDGRLPDDPLWNPDGPPDAGISTGPDGGPLDAGPGGTADVGGPFDSGVGADGGSPSAPTPRDAGPGGGAPRVARGTYVFRRMVLSGLPTGQGLYRVAVSGDDRRLVAAAYADRLYVIDRETETLLREIVLPSLGADTVRIGDVAFGPSGDYFLVAATAYDGEAATGRLYRFDADGGKPALVGTSAGMALERIVFRGASDVADLVGSEHLGGGRYVLGLHVYEDASLQLSLDETQAVHAGCEGLALAEDGVTGVARVYTCGVGGGDIGYVDATGTFVRGPGIGNVSHVDAHPSAAYALAVGWSSARLVRFQQGRWTSGAAAPSLGTPQLSKLEFSSDGERALLVGAYERSNRRAELREYRHGGYSTSDLSDVSIRGFDAAPWLGVNGSGLFDAAWRPGCDEGYIVGGCGGPSCGRGWLIHFVVTNGRACPR